MARKKKNNDVVSADEVEDVKPPETVQEDKVQVHITVKTADPPLPEVLPENCDTCVADDFLLEKPKPIIDDLGMVLPESDRDELRRFIKTVDNSEKALRISGQITRQKDLVLWGVHQYNERHTRNSFARSFYFRDYKNAEAAIAHAETLKPEADQAEMDRFVCVINNSEKAKRILQQLTHKKDTQLWVVHQANSDPEKKAHARSFHFRDVEKARAALQHAKALVH